MVNDPDKEYLQNSLNNALSVNTAGPAGESILRNMMANHPANYQKGNPPVSDASFGDYIGSTIGAANPFISLTIFAFIFIKKKQLLRDERYLLLVSIFLFVVLFFAYNSLFKFMEAKIGRAHV